MAPLPPLHVAQRETLALHLGLRACTLVGLWTLSGARHLYAYSIELRFNELSITGTRYHITAERVYRLVVRAFGKTASLRHLGTHVCVVVSRHAATTVAT